MANPIMKDKKNQNGIKKTFRLTEWKNNRGLRFVVFFLFVLLFYLSTTPKWIQETYDIALNAISEVQIESPNTVVDEAATLRARAEAAEGVQPVYSVLQMRNEELLELLFSKLEFVNADTLISDDNKIMIYKSEFPQIYRDFVDHVLRGHQETYKE